MKTNDVDAVFLKVATTVASRYHDVEADDLKQELWVWFLEQDFEPDVLDPDWSTIRTLYTVAERYAKKERTAKQGPGDSYSEGEVFALVELLVNPETNEEYARLGGEMTEVLTAVTKLPADLRAALSAKAAGITYREIADHQNVSVATAHRHVQQAIQLIVQTLNGER